MSTQTKRPAHFVILGQIRLIRANVQEERIKADGSLAVLGGMIHMLLEILYISDIPGDDMIDIIKDLRIILADPVVVMMGTEFRPALEVVEKTVNLFDISHWEEIS